MGDECRLSRCFLIPIIAVFFKVSLETLFEYDVNKVDEQIEQILTEGKNNFWNNPEKAELIFFDGIKAYPASDKLKTELLDLYVSNSPKKVRDKCTEKILDIANKIITESKDIFCICRAKSNLAAVYSDNGRYEDAKKAIESLPYMYPYMLQERMRCSAYGLQRNDRLAEAKEWKTIEWQELYIACGQEAQGYYEVGDYENALASFAESRDIIERFMLPNKQGFAAYPIGGTHSNHAHCILMIASCKYKLGQTDDLDELIKTAKQIYFEALTRDDIGNDDEYEKNMKEQKAVFTKWYNTNSGLNEYKPLVLDIK